MSYSVLVCPNHGPQGYRTVCKWCDHQLIDPRNRSISTPPGAVVLAATPLAAVFLPVHD